MAGRRKHLCRMTLVVKEDESLDPSDIGFFRHVTVMSRANRLADLIEELGFLRRCRRTHRSAALKPIPAQWIYIGAFHVVSSRSERRSRFYVQRDGPPASLNIYRRPVSTFPQQPSTHPPTQRPFTEIRFSSQPEGELGSSDRAISMNRSHKGRDKRSHH